ncbi:hypothetical protein CW749_01890 [Vibrio sp. vnigr-6D03]|uniref:hypothetical protein n=1 Tax=Vibrio sp. vnigr-6D03 TaxID=2058088 RepID=UPI000C324A25|nr:hypothetical protein [Vibrio sp. vnigr-6D03]PKF81416.1 hypothetical protein CW749_01890 [Vibrio sp. vnigr-6D03]
MFYNTLSSLTLLSLASFSANAYILVPKQIEQGNSAKISVHEFVGDSVNSCNVNITDHGSYSARLYMRPSEGPDWWNFVQYAGFEKTLTFNKSGTKTVSLNCDDGYKISKTFSVVKPKPLPKPEITINFPQGIYQGSSYDLKINTKHAQNCKLWYHQYSSSPESFGTSFRNKNLGYVIRRNQNPTNYTMKVECTGKGGKSTKTHSFNVLKRGSGGSNTPTITSFLNGNVTKGNTKLYWGTKNVTRCELKKGSIVAQVPKSSLIGYNVSVPFGGQTFKLTCSNSTKSANKTLHVPRPHTRSFRSEAFGNFDSMSQPLNLHYQSLLELGIDLHDNKYATEYVDVDANSAQDLLIFDTHTETLQLVLFGEYGEIVSHTTHIGFSSIQDIQSILIEDEYAVSISPKEQ